MSDISKCKGDGCNKRETCWRFLAPDGKWQSYIKPDPKDCEQYWHEQVYKHDQAVKEINK